MSQVFHFPRYKHANTGDTCTLFNHDIPLTVLVAHNGYKFDFPILLAEIERHQNLSTDLLMKHNIHFADTLPQLRQVCALCNMNVTGRSMCL